MSSNSDEEYDNELRERIREEADFVQEVQEEVEVMNEMGGKQYSVRCPFHDDTEPSMSFHPNEGYYCHACDAQGDIFSFVMEAKGLPFLGAMEYLMEKYGIEGDLKGVSSQKSSDPSRYDLRKAIEEAAKSYKSALHDLENCKGAIKAREYLINKRGLSEEVIRNMDVGFAPTEEEFSFRETQNEFEESVLYEAGVLAKGWTNYYYRESMKGRIVLPIRDKRGNIIGLAGRRLPGEDNDKPKYRNTRETDLYKKGKVLYGIKTASEATRGANSTDKIYVVEGYTDVLRFQMEGLKNTVAVCGTSFTYEHASSLEQIADEVIFVFDGDRAGREATLDAAGKGLPLDFTPRVCRLPRGTDPDSLATEIRVKEGFESEVGPEIEEIIERRMVSFPALVLQETKDKGKIDRPDSRAAATKRVSEAIAEIPNETRRRGYIRETARVFEAPPEEIYRKVQKIRNEKIKEGDLLVYREMAKEVANLMAKARISMLGEDALEEDAHGGAEEQSEVSYQEKDPEEDIFQNGSSKDATGGARKEKQATQGERGSQEGIDYWEEIRDKEVFDSETLSLSECPELSEAVQEAVLEILAEHREIVEHFLVHLTLSIGLPAVSVIDQTITVRTIQTDDARDVLLRVVNMYRSNQKWDGDISHFGKDVRDKIPYKENDNPEESVVDHAGEVGLPTKLVSNNANAFFKGFLSGWWISYLNERKKSLENEMDNLTDIERIETKVKKESEIKDKLKEAESILKISIKNQ